MRTTLLWVGLLLSVWFVGSAWGQLSRGPHSVPRGISIHALPQGSDSVRFVVSWNQLLDQRDSPVTVYEWQLRDVTGDSIFETQTVQQLADTTLPVAVLPGDSITVMAQVRGVDIRGKTGRWGYTSDFIYTLPDLLGPVAPTVGIDTMAYDDIVGIVVEPQFVTIEPSGTVQFCAFGVLSTGQIVKMWNSWNKPICAIYHQDLLGMQRRGLTIKYAEL